MVKCIQVTVRRPPTPPPEEKPPEEIPPTVEAKNILPWLVGGAIAAIGAAALARRKRR